MKRIISHFVLILLLVPLFSVNGATADKSATLTRFDPCKNGRPIISSVEPLSKDNSVALGTKLRIYGCNFLGLQDDASVKIVNKVKLKVKGILTPEAGSTKDLIIVTLSKEICKHNTSGTGECDNGYVKLAPGKYSMTIRPAGSKYTSNKFNFRIIKFFVSDEAIE